MIQFSVKMRQLSCVLSRRVQVWIRLSLIKLVLIDENQFMLGHKVSGKCEPNYQFKNKN